VIEGSDTLRVFNNNKVAILVVGILHAHEHRLPKNWRADVIFEAGGERAE
jgi:hypothetical protein